MSNVNQDMFRAWARAMLAHLYGARRGSRPVGEVYQTSTMTALLDGLYDGDVTIAELPGHGDFGLGTVNHLDGEMVVLDGICYHLRSDGSANVAAAADRTPFAAVTWFRPQTTIPVSSPTSRTAVLALIEDAIKTVNLIQAIHVRGRFQHVKTRTVMAQSPPYPPLTDATSDEPIAAFDDITGDLVFLDDARKQGGHTLEFELARGEIQINTSSELHLSLPTTQAFLAANLSRDNIAKQIEQSEGG